jgi:hypothetical protein
VTDQVGEHIKLVRNRRSFAAREVPERAGIDRTDEYRTDEY